MARKYFIFDGQGGCFGESGNEDGGITLKELRDDAVMWLENDACRDTPYSDIVAPRTKRWPIGDIADFWTLEIIPDHKCKRGFYCYNVLGQWKKVYDNFYDALIEARDNNYRVVDGNYREVYRPNGF